MPTVIPTVLPTVTHSFAGSSKSGPSLLGVNANKLSTLMSKSAASGDSGGSQSSLGSVRSRCGAPRQDCSVLLLRRRRVVIAH